MRAGRLRHRVELQEPTPTRTDSGQEIRGYTTTHPVWAEVTDLAGRELLLAQQVQASTTVRVRIRWLDGLTPAWRVKHGTRLLDVNNVADPEERRRELILSCSEASA